MIVGGLCNIIADFRFRSMGIYIFFFQYFFFLLCRDLIGLDGKLKRFSHIEQIVAFHISMGKDVYLNGINPEIYSFDLKNNVSYTDISVITAVVVYYDNFSTSRGSHDKYTLEFTFNCTGLISNKKSTN